ncbi:MAG: ABC transporter substrate-binding protein, partial [Clostridium sp.]|nr:ABC transporter substrate-binding protein [Clostridium sp.]
MKKTAAMILAAAMMVTSLAGCQSKTAETAAETKAESAAESESQTAGEKGTISVTYVKSPLNVPSIVEKDQGIFTDYFGKLG